MSIRVIEVCRWMLDRLGDDTQAGYPFRAQLIEALLSAGRLADAEGEIDTYLNLYGDDDLTGLLGRAQLNIFRNKREKAKEDLDSILAMYPDHPWSNFARGNLALQGGDYEAARADLEKARKLARQTQLRFNIHDRLANLHTRTGDLDLAERELRAKLALVEQQEASSGDRQQVIADLVRLLYDRARQFDRAQQVISEYMERYPDDPTWPFEMGRLFESKAQVDENQARRAAARNETRREQDFQAAARQSYAAAAPYYQRAAERCDPKDLRAIELAVVARLRALTKADRSEDAIQLFANWAERQRPSPAARIQAAKAYSNLGRSNLAREQWRVALLESAQISGTAGGAVVRELRRALEDTAAEGLLRELLETAPQASVLSVRLRLLLAGQLLAAGGPDEALEELDAVLAATSGNSLERGEALLLRAQALEQTGDRAASIKSYREILEAQPDNLVAMNNLAYSLVSSEGESYRPQEARVYADRLWQRAAGFANSGVILDTVGFVYYKNGELDPAAAALEEALAVDDRGNPVVYLHLAWVYREQGREAEARAMLNRGLEIVQSSDDPSLLELEPQFEKELGNPS
jgi:tetratricopeptide (TPR) repeat protein